MSKLICTSAIDGAAEWVARAATTLERAIAAKGESCTAGFPQTAYYLPIIYSFTGRKVQTLADCRDALDYARTLLPRRPSESVHLPYLGGALDAGAAALFACEILEACKYLIGPSPVSGIYLGAASDVIMRQRGIEFVDGTAPGFAAVTGAAPTNELAVKIARELQEKNLYVFMAGATGGKQFAEQLAEAGVQLGWETRLVPFGKDVSALVYALGFASRAALSFGGVKGGDFKGNLKYNKERIFAFVLALGEVDAEKYALAAGAINYGFPVIADTNIPQILPTGVCTYEHVVSSVPYEGMVDKALEVRGCKVRISKVPIPVPYGPAFEGERIRKADVHAEFGGNRTAAFEYVTTAAMEDITDGQIDIIGPDIDAISPGSALPLAIWVEVAGRKMQTDFEPVLERQIHHLINGAEGIWHMGQRDIVWTRVSRAGFAKGLRLRHYGEIVHAKLLADYPAIVDKVKVTMITDAAEVEKRLAVARRVYDERNRRLESMTDESVEVFYSCLLCQSFAPNHVCIITPERLGLCGAYNWLDGRASYEIDNTGPNQPVRKGECLDPVKGVWKGVNDYVFSNSHKTVDQFCAYSVMDRPMTSCGCFEVIVAYVPECNGVMAVNREFTGDTPVGMTFSTLAGNVGGGQQTPGFMGCGKAFMSSRKFLFAEGGFKRLVWMPKELKALLAADLQKRFAELGLPDGLDKIADESVATNPQEIRSFMEKVGHPALALSDMAEYAQAREDQAQKQDEASILGGGAPVPPPVVEDETTCGGTGAPPRPNEMGADAGAITAAQIAQIKAEIAAQVSAELRGAMTREIVNEIIATLSAKFLGGPAPAPAGAAGTIATGDSPRVDASLDAKTAISPEKTSTVADATTTKTTATATTAKPQAASAAQRLAAVKSFKISKTACDVPVCTVTLGATPEQGGTRGRTLQVGGATAMPMHLWEGQMPHRPLVAMEVFDSVSPKYPPVLREIYGDLLANPAEMARQCVQKYGADLISVRLEGTHPEKGARSPQQAVEVVKQVLAAVDVPVIITGHNHFDSVNEAFKAVAQVCAGENLLLNWVETDNYRTIAGAALAYGHTVVAQSPIDVNMAKQLNILLGNMGISPRQIVMDPMTGATGYGIEYTYSVMERIRLTALGGDKMLAQPMIVSPGQECAKVKELRSTAAEAPTWGELSKRAAMWELATATSLLYAGADILIMYHPQAAMATRRTIDRLMDGKAE